MNEEIHPTNASISTMWALKNFPDLNDFFVVSKHLGFQKVELNHQVDSAMLSQVFLDHTQFSSVHEPCPADISTKELVNRDWLISSTDDDSRKRGVEAIKRSVKLAYELGAQIVIIHCGNVTSDMTHEYKLRNLFKAGKTLSDEYLDTKSQCVLSRNNLVGPRFQAVKKSLKELLQYADHFKVKLGLENRYHYTDIPTMDEVEELLTLADSSQLGFIFDVGHAQALARLGFYPQEEWLKRYSSRMLGSHLHDVIGLSDHIAPGLGEIDFKTIAKFLPENAFRTLELLPGNTLEQVTFGIDLLVESGCIKYL